MKSIFSSKDLYNLSYSKKSQSSMENLMTSGWALLVVFLAISVSVFFGLLNLDSFIPDRVEIGEKSIYIIHSGTNKFLVKNIGASTLYDLWFNFTSKDCLPTEQYTLKPDDLMEYVILCNDVPEPGKKFSSDFRAYYKTKKSGTFLGQSSSGTYYVSGNFFSSEDLVVYWNMDKIYNESTQTYIKDLSLKNNKAFIPDNGVDWYGTPINNPKQDDGKINSGLSFFDKDYLYANDNDILDIGQGAGNEFTISVWFNNRKRSNGTNPMIVKNSASYSSNTDYSIYNASGKIGFGTGPESDNCAWLGRSVNLSSGWHHVVGTLKSIGYETGVKSLYVDGKKIKNCSYYKKAPSTMDYLEIGTDRRTTNNFFNGSMDEIMIFNRKLSDNEIKALFLTGW